MKRKIQPFLSLLFTIFLLQAGLAQDPVSFIASTHTAENGDAVEVSFSVTNFSEIVSAQFTIEYDPAVMEYVTVDDFGLDYMSNSNFGTPPDVGEGTVTFVWYDEALGGISVDDNEVIFSVTFEVVGVSGDSTGIDFGNNPTMIEITNTSGVIPDAGFEPGYVSVTGPVSTQEVVTDAFVFYPVSPNPVMETAFLRFDLFETQQAGLSIYDISGRIIYETSEVFLPGTHTLEIPASDFPASGTYFCRLEIDGHKGIQKLMLVR